MINDQFFLGLVYNASLLLAMVLVFELVIGKYERNNKLWFQIFLGTLIGFMGLLVMKTNWVLLEGVVFDTRSVLLGISGLFFGFVPTIVAMLITSLYRIYLGGVGVWMGVPVIISSGVIGLVWRYFRINKIVSLSWFELYFFGFVIHLVMLLLIYMLPVEIKGEVFQKIWLPVIIIYPIASLFLGVLMLNKLRQNMISDDLTESEQKYKFLFETMSQGVTIQNASGKIVEVNQAACDILGLNFEQMKGKTSYDPRWKMIKVGGGVISQDSVPSNIVLRTGKPVHDVIMGIYIPEINKYRWILTSSTPRFGKDKKDVLFTLTSFTDITDLVNAENKLKESRESYKTLFSNMADGFAYHRIILDKYQRPVDYEFIEINDSYQKMTGIDREKAIGKRVTEVVPDIKNDPFDWINAYGKVAMRGEFVNFERYFSPFRKWYSIRAYSPKKGYFAVTVSDITKKKEDEENLKKLNSKILADKQRMEAVLRDMGDAVFVTNVDKKIIMTNKAMETLFGLKEKEMIGKKIEEIMNLSYESSGEKPKDLIEKVFVNKKPARPVESLVLDKITGSKVYIDGIGTPIIDENKKLAGTVWVFRDVTKQKEIDKMKSDFISLASHQLRTPLTGIKWFIEILEENVPNISMEKVREYVGKIGESNNRMISLVNDLINTSRIDSGKALKEVKNVSLHDILKQAIETQGRIFEDKNIKINGLDQVSREIMIEVDALQLTQVFGNLFNNAAGYSPLGSDINIKLEEDAGKIRVIVEDHGLGIPLAQQSKIFTKFFRGDNVARTVPGSGLGLYVAKSIVENHGGRIWFKSAENEGTTFTVELPLKQAVKE